MKKSWQTNEKTCKQIWKEK